MSQAWHDHLANLSWWEQIDRFFFPSKYSCTMTPTTNEILFSAFLVSCTIIAIIATISKFMNIWLTKDIEAQKHE